MDRFYRNLFKASQEEENTNRPMTNKEIELTILNSPQRKPWAQRSSLGNHQI
jgi:hypothetical protein